MSRRAVHQTWLSRHPEQSGSVSEALNPGEILQFLRDRLADYKLPKEIQIVESLPHTAAGKIANMELKKLL